MHDRSPRERDAQANEKRNCSEQQAKWNEESDPPGQTGAEDERTSGHEQREKRDGRQWVGLASWPSEVRRRGFILFNDQSNAINRCGQSIRIALLFESGKELIV